MKKTKIKTIVISAMLASLTCVATMIIKIPTPLHGYANLGDCIVLLSAFLLPVSYGFCAAAIGSALADVLSGYAMYAPATFIIKGLMVFAAYFIYKQFAKKDKNKLLGKIISGFVAEVIMVAGYFIFEGFLYGFGASLVNIPANAVQGIVGLIMGILLINVFEKNKIFTKLQ
ncbi:MAG: ECF transporter S component [Acutalibacteraceae bacterium]|nr:ECF transporter S component [Acutalibacteraceae bacterium]